jgi:hypothetical protein
MPKLKKNQLQLDKRLDLQMIFRRALARLFHIKSSLRGHFVHYKKKDQIKRNVFFRAAHLKRKLAIAALSLQAGLFMWQAP